MPCWQRFREPVFEKGPKKNKKIKIKLKKTVKGETVRRRKAKIWDTKREASIRLAQSYSGFSLGAQQFCAFT